MSITVRTYRSSDAAATLGLFISAVRTTAAADYSPDQIDAWAPPDLDPGTWTGKRMELNTAVAVVNDEVVGFADVDHTGYIHMMFVDPAHGRRGVATALLQWVLVEATRSKAPSLTTHASITAGPFFQSHGFVAIEERNPVVRGVALKNHVMRRPLAL